MVRFSLIQLTDDDKDLWNEFVTVNPHAYVYHLWEWGEVLCKTYNYKKYYLAVKDDKEIIGVMPFIYVKSNIFANKIVSLPFCEYCGPLLKDGLDQMTIKGTLTVFSKVVNKLTQELKLDYTELRQPPCSLSRFLSSFGFTAMRRYLTFTIDLTKSESKLWKNLKKNTRYHVRKAMKAGIKIKDVNVNDVEDYYNLYLGTQRRHGSPPHSLRFFMNIYNTFKPKGWLQMILATYDDNPIAGEMNFLFNDKIYGWNSVTSGKYRSLNPTSLLWWYMIRWGLGNNFEVLDLGRTRLEAKGVYDFKRGWGSLEVGLEDYILSTRNVEIPDPLQRKYVFLSKMWSLLPKELARQLGPNIISKIGL